MYYVFWYTCILNMEHSGVLFIPIIQQIIKIYLTELKRYITISAYSITQSNMIKVFTGIASTARSGEITTAEAVAILKELISK